MRFCPKRCEGENGAPPTCTTHRWPSLEAGGEAALGSHARGHGWPWLAAAARRARRRLWPPRPGCSVQPRPSPEAAPRAGTSVALCCLVPQRPT